MKRTISLLMVAILMLAACGSKDGVVTDDLYTNVGDDCNTSQIVDDPHVPVVLPYNLSKLTFENKENQLIIEYYQLDGMKGELVQDYANQSLYKIVDTFGEYSNTVIQAEIIRQDDFLTIAYSGHNDVMGYDIEKYLTMDLVTATEITVDAIIADMTVFKDYFNKKSGYDYDALEGVSVYMEEDEFIFTFLPTDDSAERVYVRCLELEIGPMLNMVFEMPAS